jgi:hypothetical protein
MGPQIELDSHLTLKNCESNQGGTHLRLRGATKQRVN